MATRNVIPAAAVYAIVVGTMMAAMWAFFLATGQVPELEERPAEIVLHLIAEFGTALMLVAGGIAVRSGRRLGVPVLTLGLGMLLYTIVVSPGYYLSRGETPFVIMFAMLFVLTAVLATGVILSARTPNAR